MKRSLLIGICYFVSTIVFSQSTFDSSPQKIKLLSWNIYMLPSPIGNASTKAERAEAIGSFLAKSDYDVIVFQEAFCPQARKKIKALLQNAFPYSVGPANQKKLSMMVNSGLWIFSKHAIENTRSIAFKNKSGVDALSRKGALLVELNINGQLIQIAGTHMQNSGNASIRKAQCNEFYERLLKPSAKDGVPQILCGDFNISRKNEENYQSMLASLHATDGELEGENRFSYDRLNNDLHVENGDAQDLIDYVFVCENGASVNCKKREVKIIRKQWHNNHQDLSDHFSLAAEIQFSNTLPYASSRRKTTQ